jgi:invasion protein IalB
MIVGSLAGAVTVAASGPAAANSLLEFFSPARPSVLTQAVPPAAPLPKRAPAPAAPPQAQVQTPPAAPAATPPAPPPQPTRTEIIKFDSWTATCHDFVEGPRKRVCSALLQVQQQNTNQTVFSWTIGTNDSKQFVMVLQTPTGVMLTPGVELKFEKSSKKIAYESCEPGRCMASMVIDNNLMRDLTAAASVQVVIQAVNGNQINLNIPLKGLDKAVTQVRTAL